MLALLLSALALGPLAGRAVEIEVPANDGWVTDLAQILNDEQERALEGLMESYRAGTKHEIALLTVPSLEGEPIERFALEVGRAWGIGGKDANDGALLVVSKEDRKLRIEVGRGLEGNLTDSISGRILRDVITPAFRAGDFYGGIRRGIEAMHAAIGGDYGPLERTPEARRDHGGWMAIGMLFVMLMVLGSLGRAAGRRGRSGGGGGLWTLIWLATMLGQHGGHGRGGHGRGGFGGGGFGGGRGGGGGGFSGFGGGGGFSGGGASGGW